MDVETYRQTIWCHCLGYAPGHGPGPTPHIEYGETGAQELGQPPVRSGQRAGVQNGGSALGHMGTLSRLGSGELL
jgi:hypothetical protein